MKYLKLENNLKGFICEVLNKLAREKLLKEIFPGSPTLTIGMLIVRK